MEERALSIEIDRGLKTLLCNKVDPITDPKFPRLKSVLVLVQVSGFWARSESLANLTLTTTSGHIPTLQACACGCDRAVGWLVRVELRAWGVQHEGKGGGGRRGGWTGHAKTLFICVARPQFQAH